MSPGHRNYLAAIWIDLPVEIRGHGYAKFGRGVHFWIELDKYLKNMTKLEKALYNIKNNQGEE